MQEEEKRGARDGFTHLKSVDHVLFALDPGVGDGADLLALEVLPAVAVEVHVQREDRFRVDHVDERVALVAVVLEVDREVEEVEETLGRERGTWRWRKKERRIAERVRMRSRTRAGCTLIQGALHAACSAP